jgi:DNA-binding XRE family transcriptional regulator
MLVVVRTPHIEIRGESIPQGFLEVVKKYFHSETEVVEPAEQAEDWFESDLHKQIVKDTTPGKRLAAYRHRDGLTQAEVAKKMGVSPQEVSDMENDRRTIGLKNAKRLSKTFKTMLSIWLPETEEAR